MAREEEKLRWWWFESHNTSKHSPWLHSTLAELDAKTKEMLRLIEGNADSFAQRAETYYKRRPELISVVEDFYRAHRSLAERHDHLKSSETLSRSSKLLQEPIGSACDSNSLTNSESEEYADSEIEDPEQENASFSPLKELEPLKCIAENCGEDETWKLQQEMSKLIQESESLRGQLLHKDEEKRDVIRQLALTVETLKDENLRLKRRLVEESIKKRSVLEFEPIQRFVGKLVQAICDGKKIV